MSEFAHIDPVPLRESIDRMRQNDQLISTADSATRALLWLHEYATRGNEGPRVAQPEAIKVSTSLAFGIHAAAAEHALRYLGQATADYHTSIILRAIQIAKEDVERATQKGLT